MMKIVVLGFILGLLIKPIREGITNIISIIIGAAFMLVTSSLMYFVVALLLSAIWGYDR